MHKFKYIYPDKIKFYGDGDLATAGCLPNAPQKVMIEKKDFPGGADMEIQDMIKNLREKHNLTQEQMAERVMVTRQAVSRWEMGETQPGTDTLKLLSREFGVSINTLLGAPRRLVCQCCGMPLNEDEIISREPDGSFNEDYCKWCYADGKFMYQSKESLLDFLVEQIPSPDHLEQDVRRVQFDSWLSQLKHWK